MIEILSITGLVVLGIIILIGIGRTIFSPYTGFGNLLLELLLLDLLGDALGWVIESIVSIWDNDWD